MRILYIEDNQANIALLERVIQMSGDSLETFPTAEEALKHAKIDSFDVIFTDINLGDNLMDGLDFTATLRDAGVNVPIVAMTAYDFDEYERRAVDVGSDLYLVKPVSPSDIIHLLDEFRAS